MIKPELKIVDYEQIIENKNRLKIILIIILEIK